MKDRRIRATGEGGGGGWIENLKLDEAITMHDVAKQPLYVC